MLYEKGHYLEVVTIKAFKLFGFIADKRSSGDLDHDIVFSSKERKGIAELEGKDNDAIRIGKFDQLNRVVDEYIELNEETPTGILIGNPFRITPPDKRESPFTEKVLKAAKRKKFGLLTTLEIYKAVDYILKNPNDEDFKKKMYDKNS